MSEIDHGDFLRRRVKKLRGDIETLRFPLSPNNQAILLLLVADSVRVWADVQINHPNVHGADGLLLLAASALEDAGHG